MKSLADRIRSILKISKRVASDHALLVAAVWYQDMRKLGLSKATAKKIAILVASGKMTNSASIIRAKQRIMNGLV